MTRLRSHLAKAQHIEHPGSRGGHPWWDGHEWRYDERPIHHEYIEQLTTMGYRVVDRTDGLNEDEKERTFRSVLKAAKRMMETHRGLEHILQQNPVTLEIHSALDPLIPRVDYMIAKEPRGDRVRRLTITDTGSFPFHSAMDDYYRKEKAEEWAERDRAQGKHTQDMLDRMMGGRKPSVSVDTLKDEAYKIWAATPRGANETINKEQAAELRRLDGIIEEINTTLEPGQKPVTIGRIVREKLGKSFRSYMLFGPLDAD